MEVAVALLSFFVSIVMIGIMAALIQDIEDEWACIYNFVRRDYCKSKKRFWNAHFIFYFFLWHWIQFTLQQVPFSTLSTVSCSLPAVLLWCSTELWASSLATATTDHRIRFPPYCWIFFVLLHSLTIIFFVFQDNTSFYYCNSRERTTIHNHVVLPYISVSYTQNILSQESNRTVGWTKWILEENTF